MPASNQSVRCIPISQVDAVNNGLDFHGYSQNVTKARTAAFVCEVYVRLVCGSNLLDLQAVTLSDVSYGTLVPEVFLIILRGAKIEPRGALAPGGALCRRCEVNNI